MSTLDLPWVRSQFPALFQSLESLQADQLRSEHPLPETSALDTRAKSTPVIFFDGPGGTQVPTTVLEVMMDHLVMANANAHGAFVTSARTDVLVRSARSAAADFLGCSSDEVVFGANMTSLTFAVSRSIGRSLRPGDEIIVTQLDHDANIAPWEALQEKGVIIRYVDVLIEDCTLDLKQYQRLLNERTRWVAVGYASNAVGTINPIQQMVALAHGVGAQVFVDAVHFAPHGVIDVQALDCDFLVCSAYKFFGPHVGILYGKRRHLSELTPYKVNPAPNTNPDRWETGTPNFEGLAGLMATLRYLEILGRQASMVALRRREALVAAMRGIQTYEQQLSDHLIAGLLDIPGLTLYGICDRAQVHRRTPTVGIRIAGHSPQELAQQLGDRGIFTWHGNFYAQRLTEKLGVETQGGLLRIGLVHYNTHTEIDRLLETLKEIAVKPSLSLSHSGKRL